MIILLILLYPPFVFSSPLLNLISSLESDYLELSSKIVASFDSRCSSPCKPSYYGCGINFPQPSKCNLKFNLNQCQCKDSNNTVGSYLNELETSVTSHLSLVELMKFNVSSNQEIKELICATEFLGKEFKILSEKYPMAKWQYFGGYVGMMRDYPAQEICTFNNYVSTNWFISSITGPKNLIFIVDVSESMNYKKKIDYMKDALSALVDSLGFRDWAGLVVFNSVATTFQPFMIRMNNKNKEQMMEFIQNLMAKGLSNYEEGFKAAYEVYAATKYDDYGSINCQIIFMFFSDGKPNMGESNPEILLDLIKSWDEKTNANAHITLFNIARKSIEPLFHLISCTMKGFYFYIPSYHRIGEFISKFIILIHVKQSGPIWSEPYFDRYGLGWAITLNYAIHDQNNFFIGVLGIDFLYDSLNILDPSIDLIKIIFAKMNRTCDNIDLNDCTLEKGRTHKCYDNDFFIKNCNQIQSEKITCDSLQYVKPFFEGTVQKYGTKFKVCCEDCLTEAEGNLKVLIISLCSAIGILFLLILFIYKRIQKRKLEKNKE